MGDSAVSSQCCLRLTTRFLHLRFFIFANTSPIPQYPPKCRILLTHAGDWWVFGLYWILLLRSGCGLSHWRKYHVHFRLDGLVHEAIHVDISTTNIGGRGRTHLHHTECQKRYRVTMRYDCDTIIVLCDYLGVGYRYGWSSCRRMDGR